MRIALIAFGGPRVVPSRVAITVEWPVGRPTGPAKLSASTVLVLEPDGSFTVGR